MRYGQIIFRSAETYLDKDNAMEHIMSKNDIVYEIRRLNVTERLNIVTDIWDEIKEAQELETVSEDDKKILRNRLANFRANPDSAADWTNLKQEIHDRYAEKRAASTSPGKDRISAHGIWARGRRENRGQVLMDHGIRKMSHRKPPEDNTWRLENQAWNSGHTARRQKTTIFQTRVGPMTWMRRSRVTMKK